MSAVGVACIALVMAGVVWYERHVVGQLARRRSYERRRVRLWSDGCESSRPEELVSRRLAGAIQRAVDAADLAASYEVRWREEAKRGESPFQLKRGRMEAATRKYTMRLDTVAERASAWLEELREPPPSQRQRRRAIENLLVHLVERPREGTLSDLACLDTTVDVLENALANLYARRGVVVDPHPFR